MDRSARQDNRNEGRIMSGECEKCGEHTLECECKWINVTDRLPEKSYSSRVLAYGFPTRRPCGLEERIEFCKFDENGFEFGEYDCGFDATHWMPLPPPPKPSEE